MSIKFNVYASDGEFQKEFHSMPEAEAYFGAALTYSNVTDDGVQSFEPADPETEQLLEDYRRIRGLERSSPIDSALPRKLEIDPELLEKAKYKPLSKGNRSEWIIRTDEQINMALTTLCDASLSDTTFGQCRKDILVVMSPEKDAVFVRDLTGKAEKLGDLIGRPLEAVRSIQAEFGFPNEDEGTIRRLPVGIFIGDESAIHAAFEKIAPSGTELESLLNYTRIHGKYDRYNQYPNASSPSEEPAVDRPGMKR